MSGINKQEIDQMERLRLIMEGKLTEAKSIDVVDENGSPVASKGPSNADVDDMQRILEGFAGATGINSFKNFHSGVTLTENSNVKNTVRSSKHDTELREALTTTYEKDSMVLGNWKIGKTLREGMGTKPDTHYIVSNRDTGKKIQASFLVFESAKAICKLLNQGFETDNKTIREVAQLEIDYRKKRNKALEEKMLYERAKKKGNTWKMDLHEAKWDAAQAHALYYKERIRNVLKSLN